MILGHCDLAEAKVLRRLGPDGFEEQQAGKTTQKERESLEEC